ncbi:MAG: hypothetical protein MK135_06000 [Polyangiaceae bacterium]|nr:hypothetical protein [Polyangiaceae bacterium]
MLLGSRRLPLHASRVAFICALGVSGAPSLLWAASEDDARERAKASLEEVEASSLKIDEETRRLVKVDPENLLADAELHVQGKQYQLAIDELNQVIELRLQSRASASLEADARFLLGEAYFATDELYSAKREFDIVMARATQDEYEGLGSLAASRLVDIALRIKRPELLPGILRRVGEIRSVGNADALSYAAGKAYFAMSRYAEAMTNAESIEPTSAYGQRAAYLRGVILMKQAQLAAERATEQRRKQALTRSEQGRGLPQSPPPATLQSPAFDVVAPDYRRAVAAFSQAALGDGNEAASKGSSRAQERARLRGIQRQQIQDLSWMAVGRLYYESGRYLKAAFAYGKIDRRSERFPRALFELAWTYVRLGDYERAQRTLDVLGVLDPGLIDGADAALLRGDLLLRSGQFSQVEKAYSDVRDEYAPLEKKVAEYLRVTTDPATYYDNLTATDIELGEELPPTVIQWAREEAREERVFAMVDDVSRARTLIRRSRRIITILGASLDSESRAKIFPELLRQLQKTTALLNQLSNARLSLARGLDDADEDANDKRIAQRRRLMKRVGALPTSPGDFSIREARTTKSWNQLSQQLQRLELEADHLQAIVNGLHRVLEEPQRHGLEVSTAGYERYQKETEVYENELADYRARIDEVRESIEIGKVQSGYGDEQFQKDAELRKSFKVAFEKELSLSHRKAPPRTVSYLTSIRPVEERINIVEGRLEVLLSRLEAQARERGENVREKVGAEREKIESYALSLDALDEDARLLFGELARDNFVKVRDRMRNVVMRADVGLVQHAWEIREKQKRRMSDLLRERAREEQFINDELQEVLDDAEESE